MTFARPCWGFRRASIPDNAHGKIYFEYERDLPGKLPAAKIILPKRVGHARALYMLRNRSPLSLGNYSALWHSAGSKICFFKNCAVSSLFTGPDVT